MINKAECYSRALQTVRNRRHHAEEQADACHWRVIEEHPDVREAEQALIRLSKEKLNARIRGDGDRLQALEEKYTREKQKRDGLLSSLGLPPDAFSPGVQCPLCGDTGMTDQGICGCVKKIASKIMLEQLCDDLPDDGYSFDTFSLTYYNTQEERRQMEQIYNQCRSYAEGFTPQSESLYMMGNTGLGKTHLSFSMAKEIVSKGYAVIYCSCQSMISALEKEHFGQSEQAVSDLYMDCDLLLLDDLGTEYLSAVAQSCLYSVLNHRILQSRPTIINSNLSPDELEQRYGERLVSRIFGCYRILRFTGKDIRIQKRLASKKI